MYSKLELWIKLYSHSPNTARVYRGAVERFLLWAGMDADSFIELAKTDPERAEELLLTYREYLLKSKRTMSVKTYMTAINSFLEFNRVPIRIKNRGLRALPESIDYIPSLDEINLILSHSSIEYRTTFALIAFSGLRPCDVIQLRFENLAEDIGFDYDRQIYYAKKIPAVVMVRQDKTNRPYVTFMGPRCVSIVIDYLNYLSRKLGRPLRDQDKLFDIRIPSVIDNYFARVLKRAKIRRKHGLRWFRLYSLRKYFRRAVSRLGEDVAEFLMGHVKGLYSLSATYNGLRDFDPEAIESLRQQFASILEDLEGSGLGIKEVFDEVKKLRQELESLRRSYHRLLEFFKMFAELEPEDVQRVIELMYSSLGKRLNESWWQSQLELEREVLKAIRYHRRTK